MVVAAEVGQQHNVLVVSARVDSVIFTLKVVCCVVDAKQTMAVNLVSIEHNVV